MNNDYFILMGFSIFVIAMIGQEVLISYNWSKEKIQKEMAENSLTDD